MTDKRLKEIKDSIELQLEVSNQLGIDNELALEEKELCDYAEELRKKLKEKDEGFKAVVEEIQEYAEENEKLKKQVNSGLYSTCLPYKTGYDKAVEDYKTQQQEFINWLKAMLKMYEEEYKDIDISEHYNSVLQKYEEIIGNDINVGSKGGNKDEN